MRAGAGGRGGARTAPSIGRRGTLQSSVGDSAKVPICLLWVNQVGGTYFLDRLYGPGTHWAGVEAAADPIPFPTRTGPALHLMRVGGPARRPGWR